MALLAGSVGNLHARKDEEILSLKNEVCRLKSVIRAYGKVCEAISADLGKAPDCHD